MNKPALGNLGRLFISFDRRLKKYILWIIEIRYLEQDMSKQPRVEVTFPNTGRTHAHTRIESWGGDGYHDRYFQFDARRVVCDGDDQAQIEVTVVQTTVGKKRTATICGSVVLDPNAARALALAICPELDPTRDCDVILTQEQTQALDSWYKNQFETK